MDKFSELKAVERFDADIEENGGEPFAVWVTAINGSHVFAKDYDALLAELEAKDKRIAELEAIATDYAGKFQKAQDAAKHLIIMNDGAQAEIAHLKALLATPVRLKKVDSSNVPFAGDGFNAAIDYCADSVRAAGFTVGDE